MQSPLRNKINWMNYFSWHLQFHFYIWCIVLNAAGRGVSKNPAEISWQFRRVECGCCSCLEKSHFFRNQSGNVGSNKMYTHCGLLRTCNAKSMWVSAYEYLSTSDNLMALESRDDQCGATGKAMRLVVMTTPQHPHQPPRTVQHELDELRRRRRRSRWPQRWRGRECAGPLFAPLVCIYLASAARFCMFFDPVFPRFSHPPHSSAEMCRPLTLTAMRIFESSFVWRHSGPRRPGPRRPIPFANLKRSGPFCLN